MVSRATHRTVVGWTFALPFAVLFLVFMAGPVLASLGMSLTDIRSTDLRTPLSVGFIGLDNYAQLFTDSRFIQAAWNTIQFVVIGVPLTIVLALAVALGIDRGITRFRTVFRVGYYLPVVTSIVAIAVVWRFLLHPDSGMVNGLLRLVGINGPHWLADENLALPSLIVMAAWRGMGTLMVIFLAGLQGIPRSLYEAAEIDGAGPWQRLRSITLPMLRPTMLFAAVITGIGYLQVFEEPFVMTQGTPLDRTLTVSYYIYNQFGFGNYGYAAAMSYVLFSVIVALTVLQFRLLRPKT
ncbi:multiple sugar transport system permease protein [Kibdelosporangium banguiense]|uniref:Multiple sugar transport system permease protein n=1 Tax=Kibdelosporangium banguiense TaxID=1365924 RepID=A0ABS4TPM8_9PSEU|nr:sugar ABC transporter permease [Kibdelosporangium banguiense]MBP2326357.1 multiple sugar transport system permease protein [Kibdelosporangium banguiense]